MLSGDAAACITVDEEGLPSMQVSPLAASLTTGSTTRASCAPCSTNIVKSMLK